MKLIGLMPVRNEAWVVGLSARVALRWCDALVILVHASVDSTDWITEEIQREHPGRVAVIQRESPVWDEMGHRQALLTAARSLSATHIAMVDADEVLTGNLLDEIRFRIENLGAGHILTVPGYNLRGGLTRYHANGVWGNRQFSLAFADDGRATWRGDQFHHREPFDFRNAPSTPYHQQTGGILHLWGASERRLVAKHALYKMTERLRWPNKPVREINFTYDLAIRESASDHTQYAGRWAFAQTQVAWWKAYADLMRYVDMDAAPWQESEVHRLWNEHGPERFAGLDLFGVAMEEAHVS